MKKENPVVSPEQWVVIGSPQWLDSVREMLSRQTHPLVVWRMSCDLIAFVDAKDLLMAVNRALHVGAPEVVRVLFESRENLEDIHALLRDPANPEGYGRRVLLYRVKRLEGIVRSLQKPDGLAAEQWLMGGRQEFPVIGLPTGNEDFTRAATAAFKYWADEFLVQNDPDELDEIYGNGGEYDDEPGPPELDPA